MWPLRTGYGVASGGARIAIASVEPLRRAKGQQALTTGISPEVKADIMQLVYLYPDKSTSLDIQNKLAW
jgi:hypothetical protein